MDQILMTMTRQIRDTDHPMDGKWDIIEFVTFTVSARHTILLLLLLLLARAPSHHASHDNHRRWTLFASAVPQLSLENGHSGRHGFVCHVLHSLLELLDRTWDKANQRKSQGANKGIVKNMILPNNEVRGCHQVLLCLTRRRLHATLFRGWEK